MQILSDPTPVEGGGTASTQTTTAQPAAVAAPVEQASTATPPPATIPMPVDQYTRLIDLERQHVAARDEAERKAREAEAKALQATVGEGEAKTKLEQYTAASQMRESLLEQKIKAQSSRIAIAEAMAGIAFVDDQAREDAMILLTGMVVVEKDNSGEYVTLDRDTRQDASKALREKLLGPRFARYRAASQKGGGGGGNTPPSTGHEGPDEKARRLATAERLLAGRGGHPSGNFGGFANGKVASN